MLNNHIMCTCQPRNQMHQLRQQLQLHQLNNLLQLQFLNIRVQPQYYTDQLLLEGQERRAPACWVQTSRRRGPGGRGTLGANQHLAVNQQPGCTLARDLASLSGVVHAYSLLNLWIGLLRRPPLESLQGSLNIVQRHSCSCRRQPGRWNRHPQLVPCELLDMASWLRSGRRVVGAVQILIGLAGHTLKHPAIDCEP